MFTIDKYNYNIQARYTATDDFLDVVKGIKLGGVTSSQPYTLSLNYPLSEIPSTASTIQLKVIGVEGGTVGGTDHVSTRTIITTCTDSSVVIDSSGIITIPLSSYSGKTYSFTFTDTYAAESSTFTVNLTMIFTANPFSSYTYSLYYKILDTKPTDISTVDETGIVKLFTATKFTSVVNYPFYDGICQSNDVTFALNDIAGKYIYYKLVRDAYSSVVETTVYKNVEMIPKHIYRYTMYFTDTDSSGTTSYKLLYSFRQFLDIENAPLHYYIDKIIWDNEPASIQKIDLLITDGDTTHTNANGTIQTVGNTVLYVTNVMVDKNGYFIDSTDNSKKKKFFLNCTYDENGNLTSGSEWNYEANEKFDEDTKYNLYIINHATDKAYTKSGYTPKTLSLGQNIIWDNIFFPGQAVELYTTGDMSNVDSPDSSVLQWYFELANSVKAVSKYVAGSLIYPGDNTNITDFHWADAASSDDTSEKYTASYINGGHYLGIPNNYYKASYDLNGLGFNAWPIDLFGDYDYTETPNADGSYPTDSEYTTRTMFFKFYLATGSTTATLIDIKGNSNRFCLNVDITNNNINITNGSTTTYSTLPLTNQTLKNDKWYTLLMVVQHGVIKYINITDRTNYNNAAVAIGTGFGYNPGTEDYVQGVTSNKRINCDKTALNFSVNYTCNSTGGDDEIAICPCATVYQYVDNNNLIYTNNVFSNNYITLKHNTTATTESTTFDPSGYSIIPGFKIIGLKGGSTTTKTIVINSITFGSTTYTSSSGWSINTTDSEYTVLFSNVTSPFSSFSVLKTNDVLSNAIGGDWLVPSTTSYNNLVNTGINKDTFVSLADTNRIFVGNSNGTDNGLYMCKIGITKQTLTKAIDIADPYKFMPSSIMRILGGSYKNSPVLTVTYEDATTVKVTKKDFKEFKPNKAWIYLPLTLATGKCTFDLSVGSTSFYNKVVEIQSVKPDDSTIDFEIDFSTDFDAAVTKFKDLFYGRQEKRAGDLSGGENPNNVYFSREEKACVMENHGDLYKGKIPCNEKDSGNNRWYGGAAPMLQYNLDSSGNVIFYDSNNRPDPLKQRNIRVGSLIQSKKYYGYGEFEMDMKIPKGLKGAAVCWWMFHYQEWYKDSIGDDRFYKQYVGGMSTNKTTGDDNPLVYFNIGDKKGKWNYLHKFYRDSGLPYLIVNNEIDMEIGSETCNINDTNPPASSAQIFYLPIIDEKTCMNCTTPGSDYGLWMIDWEASQTMLNQKWAELNAASDSTGEVDVRNASYLGVVAKDLTWIHISNTICDQNVIDANTRALRWNNWWTQEDIYGTIYKSSTSLDNAVKAYNGDTITTDGTTGWDINNTVASMTIRTPLGTFDKTNADITKRYIPKYLDDDAYHTYKFTWDDKSTKIYIDGVLIKTNYGCVPFTPMPFLIGTWFPTFDAWKVGSDGYFGTWAGQKAEWDIMPVMLRRVKYTHYTEAQAPRTNMLYHSETYPYTGLREIIKDKVTHTVTTRINNSSFGSASFTTKQVEDGKSVRAYFTANTGYIISNMTGIDTFGGIGESTGYGQISSVTSNATISCVFSAKPTS